MARAQSLPTPASASASGARGPGPLRCRLWPLTHRLPELSSPMRAKSSASGARAVALRSRWAPPARWRAPVRLCRPGRWPQRLRAVRQSTAPAQPAPQRALQPVPQPAPQPARQPSARRPGSRTQRGPHSQAGPYPPRRARAGLAGATPNRRMAPVDRSAPAGAIACRPRFGTQSIFGAPGFSPARREPSGEEIRERVLGHRVGLLLGPVRRVGGFPIALGLDARGIVGRDPASLDQPRPEALDRVVLGSVGYLLFGPVLEVVVL